ncbi:MAG TPA: ATP-binding cassette domain-containing protein [Arenicellales bacterium]|jgi:ABC-2 type transport system ATP-binding protein|nr:ATP-binding cassette domain-containing protein [Arenicellales bacterium]
MVAAVLADGLHKIYQVPVRGAGIQAALKSLVHRETEAVQAVKNVNLEIAEGEVVGFLGPNGAGKTTTIKMLTGLLHPTTGIAQVFGYQPAKREHQFLMQITLVMGQRNQLLWDIPVIDSFDRNRVIYKVSKTDYEKTLDELVALLDLDSLLHKPVRNLSLGERMKCEIAVALLHRPRMLFLDEPTIGLDVTMQRKLREFITQYNQQTGATVLLTSHYMADVQALCKRVIVIHHGSILFDGYLDHLVQRFTAHKTISIKLSDPLVDLSGYGELITRSEEQAAFRIPNREAANFTSRLLRDLDIVDLTVEDPPIEEIIESVFNQSA